MLAARCPQCGSPAPVSVATPDDMSCPACRWTGPPPPEAAEALRRAAAVLARCDQDARKLGGAQRRALGATWQHRALFFGALALFGLPLVCCAGVVVLPAPEGVETSVQGKILFLGPLAAFAALAVVLTVVQRLARRGLEHACAAVPPQVPGEPARCHVCGGPLLTGGTEPLVGCGFCHAENLVTAGALERARARTRIVLEGLEQEVERQARSVGSTARLASALLLPSALAGPPLALSAMCCFALFGSRAELGPDADARFALWDTPSGRCVARVRERRGRTTLAFGFPPPAGLPDPLEVPAERLAPVPASWFVGREVTIRGRSPETVWRVQRVYRSPTFLDEHQTELADGRSTRTEDLTELCLPAGAPEPTP